MKVSKAMTRDVRIVTPSETISPGRAGDGED
jgi:hypothetical protein